MKMQNWEERPFEIAYNLNPAYCTTLLNISIAACGKRGMPYPIIFLILPLVIYAPIRNKLPCENGALPHLSLWISKNEIMLQQINFPEKVKELVPYTKEALMFAMNHNVIYFTSCKLFNKEKLKPNFKHSTLLDCQEKAKVLGKWFSDYNIGTIYGNFGIRP